MPKLTIRSGPRSGRKYSFERSAVVGRGPMADLRLDNPTVSRRHAMLTWENDECFVSDLDSENGTWVNNQRLVEPTRLNDGDRLNFGTVEVQFGLGRRKAASPLDTFVRVIEREDDADASRVVMTMAPESAQSQELAVSGRAELLETMSRRLAFLNETSQFIASTFDENAVLTHVLDHLFRTMPAADRAFVMVWDPEEEKLEPRAARNRSGEVEEIAASRTLLDEVMRKREGVLVVESTSDTIYREAASMHALQIRSAICVPMLCRDELYGVLQIDSATPVASFKKTDMALVMAVASQIAMFLANSRLHERLVDRELLERDMMLARRIQMQFLPQKLPRLADYEFAIDYSPALAVGGDLYHFLELGGGLAIAVGDVSGKGVSAALYAARLGSELRYQSVGQARPSTILSRLNAAMSRDSEAGMFVTLALLVLETDGDVLTLASAGHLEPLVRSGDGTVGMIGETGDPPLGLDADTRFRESSYRLEPDDIVVLYSDGISEAENTDRELFGMDRLRAAVARGTTAEEVLSEVLSDVKRFVGNAPQSDDITLLCVRRTR